RLRLVSHPARVARDGLGLERALERLRALLADRDRRLSRPVVVAALVLLPLGAAAIREAVAARQSLRRPRDHAPRLQGRPPALPRRPDHRRRRPRPPGEPARLPGRSRSLLRAALRDRPHLVAGPVAGLRPAAVLVRRARRCRPAPSPIIPTTTTIRARSPPASSCARSGRRRAPCAYRSTRSRRAPSP